MLAAGTLAALGLRTPAFAQAPTAGKDYTVLAPAQSTESPPGKIEVAEFFWYGCIHCYNLEPTVNAWLKTIPADVSFRRVPAIFNDRWALDASLFYTFEAMGLTEKTHASLFESIHQSRLRTDSPQAMAEWFKKHGIDVRKFEEMQKSFGVQSKVKRAFQQTAAYKIDGTPALAVHGGYTISADQGRSAAGMFAVADYLVGLVRKNGGAKK